MTDASIARAVSLFRAVDLFREDCDRIASQHEDTARLLRMAAALESDYGRMLEREAAASADSAALREALREAEHYLKLAAFGARASANFATAHAADALLTRIDALLHPENL